MPLFVVANGLYPQDVILLDPTDSQWLFNLLVKFINFLEDKSQAAAGDPGWVHPINQSTFVIPGDSWSCGIHILDNTSRPLESIRWIIQFLFLMIIFSYFSCIWCIFPCLFRLGIGTFPNFSHVACPALDLRRNSCRSFGIFLSYEAAKSLGFQRAFLGFYGMEKFFF